MKTISILGCGWLGLPLGTFLASKGYLIKGSTTQINKFQKLRDANVTPYQITLEPDLEANDFASFIQSQIIIINIPPQTRTKGQEFHPKQIESFQQNIPIHLSPKIIFISSTSVYPPLNRAVNEKDIIIDAKGINMSLIKAEEILKGSRYNTTILRCGGLMGKNRIPGKYFQGKKIDTGDYPVNYIHYKDVINIIFEIIQQNIWDETFNLVAPLHPTRAEVYRANALKYNLELPIFVKNTAMNYKTVLCEKLINRLKYTFLFPNPLEFEYQN